MRRIVFVLKVVIVLWLFVVISINGMAQVPVDVDSLGNIWVFAIDKSGSMEKNPKKTSREISDIIMGLFHIIYYIHL